jgi:glycine betaine/proline transport system permease protein
MAFRNAALVYVLIPVKDVLSWLPWTVVVAGVGLIGYVIGGRRLALLCAALLAFPAVMGLWVPTITTIYMIGIAITICILLGFPLGLLAARSDRFSRIIMPVCDTLQTLPSFIYLVPVVMLFKVGDVAAIMAVIGYSMVPIVRFTNLGLRRVPAQTREAAIASGASSFQLLRKVDLPLALPEIMLGVNQTIVMGLFTLSITALVGARDLGAQIIKALATASPGQGLIAGLCVACLAITADRLIAQWSRARKKKLGLA